MLVTAPSRSPTAALPGIVRAQALALLQAALAGHSQPLLKGKKLGLLCEDAQATDALLFQRAAHRLGAYVAHIRPSLSHLSAPAQVQHTARMLGRLYDAVECQGMAAGLVRQIGLCTDVPVFDQLAAQAGNAELLDGQATPTDDLRCFVLQALLLHALT